MPQQLPVAWRQQFLQDKSSASARIADNCALPKNFRPKNVQYQAFAFFQIVASAPILMAVAATFAALWILLISSARSRYLSHFSYSVVRIFWLVGTAMSISVHSCVPLRTTVISGLLFFCPLSAVKIVIS